MQFDAKLHYDYAMRHVGTRYKYGGSTIIEGIDCSGLVLELMVSQDAWKHGVDASAQTIYSELVRLKCDQLLLTTALHGVQPGACLFYSRQKNVAAISHIASAITPYTMVEAGGGDEETRVLEDAIKAKAMVRCRTIASFRRSELVAIINPWSRAS